VVGPTELTGPVIADGVAATDAPAKASAIVETRTPRPRNLWMVPPLLRVVTAEIPATGEEDARRLVKVLFGLG
jgi:hypothetical protein